jgi:hypothetical protein
VQVSAINSATGAPVLRLLTLQCCLLAEIRARAEHEYLPHAADGDTKVYLRRAVTTTSLHSLRCGALRSISNITWILETTSICFAMRNGPMKLGCYSRNGIRGAETAGDSGRIIPQTNEEYGHEDHYPLFAIPGSDSADALRPHYLGHSNGGGYQTAGRERRPRPQIWPEMGGGWINARGDDTMTMFLSYGHMVGFTPALSDGRHPG